MKQLTDSGKTGIFVIISIIFTIIFYFVVKNQHALDYITTEVICGIPALTIIVIMTIRAYRKIKSISSNEKDLYLKSDKEKHGHKKN